MSFESAREISAQFTSGKTSAAETIETTLNRISELNPKVNAFTSVIADRARAKAKSIDAARAEGRELGALAGVPFAVKDLYRCRRLDDFCGIEDQPQSSASETRLAAD